MGKTGPNLIPVLFYQVVIINRNICEDIFLESKKQCLRFYFFDTLSEIFRRVLSVDRFRKNDSFLIII